MPNNLDSIISLLVQIPLVGIFIWYTMKMSKEFREYIEARDEQWRKTIRDLTDQLRRNTNALIISVRKGDTTEITKQFLDELRCE